MTSAAMAWFAWALAASLVASTTPVPTRTTTAPTAPVPFENNQSTSFGSIQMRAYVDGSDGPVPVEARIVFKSEAAVADSDWFMFAFNVQRKTSHVELTSLGPAKGGTINISRDERGGNPTQPRIWVTQEDLSAGTEYVLKGRAWADRNGQFHVGAFVIAFDPTWNTTITPEGELAQLYAFSMLSVAGLEVGAGAPPFEGLGNPAWLIWGIAMGLFFTGAWALGRFARWRRESGRLSIRTPPP